MHTAFWIGWNVTSHISSIENYVLFSVIYSYQRTHDPFFLHRKPSKTPPHRFTHCGRRWRRKTRPSSVRASWRRRSTSWRSRAPSRSTRRGTETSPSWRPLRPPWRARQAPRRESVRTTWEARLPDLRHLLHPLHCQETGHVGSVTEKRKPRPVYTVFWFKK